MGDILLLTQGTGGDVLPFVQIGRALRSRGHRVTLFVNRERLESVRGSGLACELVERLPPYEVWAEEERAAGRADAARPRYLAEKILSTVEIIGGRYRAGESLVVGHYGMHLPIQTSADRLGAPYLPVYTAPYFMQYTPLAEEMYATHSAALNLLRGSIGLAPVADWREWLRAPRRGVGLWPEWYAAPQPGWPRGVEPVGFIWDEGFERGELPAEVRALLEGGRAPVLITHGTSRPDIADFFEVGAKACRMLGRPALLVTPHADLAARCAGDGVFHYEHLPFATLMPQLGAVVHHGGIGTSAQALASGVPQLVLPFGFDRPDNATRLRKLGGADSLPPVRWRPETVADSLRRLLGSPEVAERCRELARTRPVVEPAAAACRVIEAALAEAPAATPPVPQRGARAAGAFVRES